MSYFTKDYLPFLAELSLNNDREWFHANKQRFKDQVEAPFKKFLEDLIDQASALDSRISITPKEAMFRIYRDTRFSKDKTPYKTHLSAVIAEGGRKGDNVGIYIQSSAEEFRIYTGLYRPKPKQVQLVREAIATDMEGFQAILDNKNFKKLFGQILGEEHKRVPKEFADLVEQQPLFKKKSYYAFNNLPPETILKKNIVNICMKHFVAAQPLGKFFDQAIKT